MVWNLPGTDASAGKALCNEILLPNNDAKNFELFGMEPNETLVFEGDRFDTKAKTMNASADNTWFNFGCAGHALAKLYLNRSTVNTQPQPSWEQRQAMFKMIVGDYCGSRTGLGETFTLTGEPIMWKGGLQTSYPSQGQPTIYEAPLDARW